MHTEEKFLIEGKLEDGKTLSIEDSIKVDHVLLNKKRNIDNFDSLNTKKKIDNRIRVTEMTLNESKIEVLSEENLKEAKNKVALLYTKCEYLDYEVEDTKEMISLFNKKEKFFKDRTDKSIELLLEETPVTKTNFNVESKDKIVINSSYNNIKLNLQTRLTLWDLLASLRLAKIRRCFNYFGKITAIEWRDFNKTRAVFDLNILEGAEINNNTEKKELDHLWNIIHNVIIKAANQTLPKKKILNTGNPGKIKKHCEIIVNNQSQILMNLLNKLYNKIIINKLVLEKQDHSRELITKPEEVLSQTEKHFQNQYQKRNTRPNLLTQKWADIYKPASYVQENFYKNLLEEVSEKEWKQILSSLSLKSASGISGTSYILIKNA
ncbi:25415_t:CDS:2, partial [Gigaspora margarita]